MSCHWEASCVSLSQTYIRDRIRPRDLVQWWASGPWRDVCPKTGIGPLRVLGRTIPRRVSSKTRSPCHRIDKPIWNPPEAKSPLGYPASFCAPRPRAKATGRCDLRCGKGWGGADGSHMNLPQITTCHTCYSALFCFALKEFLALGSASGFHYVSQFSCFVTFYCFRSSDLRIGRIFCYLIG